MMIDIEWDTQFNTAIVMRFNGEWTWHACKEALQTLLYMRESRDVRVAYILDLHESTLVPRSAHTLLTRLLKSLLKEQPSRVVIIDKLHRLATLQAMLPFAETDGIDYAQTIEEARLYLKRAA